MRLASFAAPLALLLAGCAQPPPPSPPWPEPGGWEVALDADDPNRVRLPGLEGLLETRWIDGRAVLRLFDPRQERLRRSLILMGHGYARSRESPFGISLAWRDDGHSIDRWAALPHDRSIHTFRRWLYVCDYHYSMPQDADFFLPKFGLFDERATVEVGSVFEDPPRVDLVVEIEWLDGWDGIAPFIGPADPPLLPISVPRTRIDRRVYPALDVPRQGVEIELGQGLVLRVEPAPRKPSSTLPDPR